MTDAEEKVWINERIITDLRHESERRLQRCELLEKRIHQYDRIIQAVATALGGVCCGGIDVDGPGSTERVLVTAIEKLRLQYDARSLYLQDAEARIRELTGSIVRK